MPEGLEIRRAADTLEAAIKGEPLTEAWFAFPQLQPYQTQLIGQRVTHTRQGPVNPLLRRIDAV
ncbi:endonuclease VIII [Klebsiella pneumoniae subsp. ozaenae]|uniref:Endonuclease VIII n=1 Tax=Klebsiella pneumoniae subsp. ozaenae TaxID=574 RepID=A0A378BT11_KLEPO|nr:endonuclease VIII [Klebsiella pneumoniae subsp. ozaenae]VFS41466.1 DNA glycosylase/AP lyase Nei [Serratia liquefaciens]